MGSANADNVLSCYNQAMIFHFSYDFIGSLRICMAVAAKPSNKNTPYNWLIAMHVNILFDYFLQLQIIHLSKRIKGLKQ